MTLLQSLRRVLGLRQSPPDATGAAGIGRHLGLVAQLENQVVVALAIGEQTIDIETQQLAMLVSFLRHAYVRAGAAAG